MSDFDNGLPDLSQLEALANQYFRSGLDGGAPDAAPGARTDYPTDPHFSIHDPVTSFQDADYTAGGTQPPADEVSGVTLANVYDRFTPSEAFQPSSLPELPGARPAFDYTFPYLPKDHSSFYFLSGAGISPFAPDLAARGVPAAEAARPAVSGELLDVYEIRKEFPILSERIDGRPVIWLDNAATTQKPRTVIDRISHFYTHENSNVHRGAHALAARATDAYEAARETVRQFLNASSVNEIVFVRGTTEAINLVAKSWGLQHLKEGDEIIVSHLEHHANIVPWQQLAKARGVKLKVIPVDDQGQLLLEEYTRLLASQKVKLVAVTHVSNALGTVTPVRQIVRLAHEAGARVLIDGAQSVSHLRVDLQDLDPDWFVFSGHKIFGPTGIGVLYGKEDLLNSTQPWQGGGNMIRDVTFEHTVYHKSPGRFEAGTGNIADAVGLGAALNYVQRIGLDRIHAYEDHLLKYATRLLKEIPGLRLVGTAENKASVVSFTLKGYTNGEVGQALSDEGIAVRTGHHCAQPILRRFGLENTVRPSLAFYNTTQEIDALVGTLHKLRCRRTQL